MNTNESYHYCQNKVAKSGSSFYYSFLFLTKPKKQAIMALYAFCREIDDIVDESKEVDIAQKKLDFWSNETSLIQHAKPSHPVAIALKDTQQKFNFECELLNKIIEGMQMDLRVHSYQDMAHLYEYTYRAASVVGLLSAKIFGATHASSDDFAIHLGHALQLINIIRDVGEDARRKRVYIPQDLLDKYNCDKNQILKLQDPPELKLVLQQLAKAARKHFKKAVSHLHPADRKAHLASLIMANIYLKLLDEIESTNFNVMHQKIKLTPLRKCWIAWRTFSKQKKLSNKLQYENS